MNPGHCDRMYICIYYVVDIEYCGVKARRIENNQGSSHDTVLCLRELSWIGFIFKS